MWRDELERFVERFPHPAWGPSHCRRVHALSRSLMEAEGVTGHDEVLLAVAYLHDLGAFEPYGTGGAEQAEHSARAAEEVLPSIGFPEERRGLVVEIVRGHGFDRDPGPRAEAQAFHDADILDFMGAVGVTRLLSIVGVEDWVPTSLEAVRIAEEFARTLPDRLVLDSASRLAERRRGETVDFLAYLREETAGFADL